MTNKYRKSAKLLVSLVLAFVLTCNLLPISAFAKMVSPSAKCVTEIYQLAPENQSLMESYVIKTPNGKLIVIDGGIEGAGANASPYITSALRAIAGVGEGEHFTVDAWFISHAHGDHHVELTKILCAYTDDPNYTGDTIGETHAWTAPADKNFTIENFYFDFPVDGEWPPADDRTGSVVDAKFKEGLQKYAEANGIPVTDTYYNDLNGKVVNQEAIDEGLTITIDGVDFQILQTWSTEDGQVNDNSMIIRMVHDGESVLFLNDATVASGHRLLNKWGADALKSDIVQLAHHGQAGCDKAFYDAIDAKNSVRLWPCAQWIWEGTGYQTPEVRTWFGLEEHYEDYVQSKSDFVAGLYDTFPTDPTSVEAWKKVIDTMKITLPQELSYRDNKKFDLVEEATVRVGTEDGITGLRFSAVMAQADDEAEYGFVIVPKTYVEEVQSASGFNGDYVSALIKKYGENGIIKMNSRPIDKGTYFQINGSVGDLKFANMTMEYTPVAFMYKDGSYTCASFSSIDNISANPFREATKAYNNYPNSEYLSVYKGFVDRAINLINGNEDGTPVTSYKFAFDKDSIDLMPGEETTLTLDTDFYLDTVDIDYDDEVISYDPETGKVAFVKCGTTEITATCMGMTETVKVSCTVEVEGNYLAMFNHEAYVDLIRKNDFVARDAKSVTAVMEDSYTDANGVTETNVAKITTVCNDSSDNGDFVIDLPKAVNPEGTKKVTVRMLVQSSDAKFLRFRNVEGGGEENSSIDITAFKELDDSQKNVWMDVVVDYSETDADYMDRLCLLVTGGAQGGTHTFYVAYVEEQVAVNTETVKSELAAGLTGNYIADFSSSLYQGLISTGHYGTENGDIITTTWLDSFEGESGVLKIETGGAWANLRDFIIDLPKSHNGSYTLRMYVPSSNKAAQVGIQANGNSWSYNWFASLGTELATDTWNTILVSSSENDGFDNQKIAIQGYLGGVNSIGTMTVYLSWILDGTDVKSGLAASLTGNYIADFSSDSYKTLVSDGNLTDTITTTWLESFEGEEGVLKIEAGGAWSTTRDFVIDLPKSHSGSYTLRMYIPTTNVVDQLGTATSTEWGATVLSSPGLDEWRTVIVNNGTKDEGYNKQKIRIQGFKWYAENAGTMTVYLSWILDGNANISAAEDTWRSNITASTKTTLSAGLETGYLADFSAEGYKNLIFGCSDVYRTPASVTSTWLESYTDASNVTANGVLKTEIVLSSLATGDFLIELPKSITGNAVTMRYALVYGDESNDAGDAMRFKLPEATDVAGMGLTSSDRQTSVNGAPGYDLIGDGSWNTVTLNWNSSIKDYLEFQLGTRTPGEKITLYLDFVYDGVQ